MKILIILIRWEGGVGRVVSSIKPLLEKKGYKVEVISREDDLNYFSTKKAFFKSRKEVNKRNYDIIYTQDWSCALPFLFYKKHYCCFHGNEPRKTRFLQTLIGKIMTRKLIVVGDSLKKRFPKSNLVYNGVNLQKFKPNPKVRKIKNSVGFASWTTSEYHFSQVKEAAEKLKKRLIVAKNIPKEKMPEFYRKLEAFVSLPPSYASFGLVNLEAMASGIPKIIGSNLGGGHLLPITKIENFRNNLSLAIKNAQKRDYRGWIRKNNFTWKRHTEKILEIFNKSLKKK